MYMHITYMYIDLKTFNWHVARFVWGWGVGEREMERGE